MNIKEYKRTLLHDDLKEFFGWTQEFIDDCIVNRHKLKHQEWYMLVNEPKNAEDTYLYYAEGIGEFFDCIAGSGNINGSELLEGSPFYLVADGYIMVRNWKNILDVGPGTGRYGIIFHNLGWNVTYCDIPGKMYNFLKWRTSKQERNDIEFLNVTDENRYPWEGKEYSVIVCYDVMEHVFEPVEMLKSLTKSLVIDGLMIMDVFFHHDPNLAPCHLKENMDKYAPTGVWHEIMLEYGYKDIWYDGNGSPKIYRKIKN